MLTWISGIGASREPALALTRHGSRRPFSGDAAGAVAGTALQISDRHFPRHSSTVPSFNEAFPQGRPTCTRRGAILANAKAAQGCVSGNGRTPSGDFEWWQHP